MPEERGRSVRQPDRLSKFLRQDLRVRFADRILQNRLAFRRNDTLAVVSEPCRRNAMKNMIRTFAVLGLLLPSFSAAQNQRRDDGQYQDQRYGSSQGRWKGRLSAEDQAKFDSYYSRWLDYKRTNNRDEIVSMENRLRDVMSRYNIPSDVFFGQIASNNNQSYGVHRGDDGGNDNRRPAQGALGNPQRAGGLTADDQARFDSYYSRWLNYRRTNNRDEVASMEDRMRDLMAHNSIPSNTAFSQIASPTVQGGNRLNAPRFSDDDERQFRSYYSRWQEYRRSNNRDETASMERRMRDVMDRHNIPNDVPYDEVMNMLNGDGRD
jgi:hypothetical protein